MVINIAISNLIGGLCRAMYLTNPCNYYNCKDCKKPLGKEILQKNRKNHQAITLQIYQTNDEVCAYLLQLKCSFVLENIRGDP